MITKCIICQSELIKELVEGSSNNFKCPSEEHIFIFSPNKYVSIKDIIFANHDNKTIIYTIVQGNWKPSVISNDIIQPNLSSKEDFENQIKTLLTFI